MLTEDSKSSLYIRTKRGDEFLRLAWGGKTLVDEDRKSAGKDAISDILTALFGPAGMLVDDGGGGRVELDREAVENASALIDAALQSYFGDAEDYVEDEEPVKPVADIDVVVIRDPDFSNEIRVFGDEANVVNIDVGADDLHQRSEWVEWCETQEQAMKLVSTLSAQRLIVQTVADYAESFNQPLPSWVERYLAG